MKIIPTLATLALIGFGFLATSLSTGRAALGLFAATASALIILGVVRDYAPRRPLWQPGRSPLRGIRQAHLRATEPMKLAA